MRRTRFTTWLWPWIFLSVIVLVVLLLANTPTIASDAPGPAAPLQQGQSEQRCPGIPPDPFGYRCDDTQATIWIPASTNTGLNGDNQVVQGIPIGFTFSFYGAPYTNVNVSANGNLQFTTTNQTDFNNTALPNATMGAMIAPFWDDLSLQTCYSIGTCRVLYSTTGTGSNRIFTVEWRSVPHLSDPSNPLTFEVQLFESSNDIWVIYQNMPGIYGNGSDATLGIQGGPSSAFQYSYLQSVVTNNLTIRYFAGAPGNTYTPTFTATPTRTSTSTPTRTPTSAVTLTPDPYEINDTCQQARDVAVGGTYTNINFVPVPPPPAQDVDYFRTQLKDGHTYRIRTILDGIGIDSYLRLFAPDCVTLLAENDDANLGTLASEIVWSVTTGRDETYYFQATNIDPSDPRQPGKTYRFEVIDQSLTPGPSPTITRSPTPGPTQIGGLDPYEPNYDFDHAYPIGAGTFATPGPTYAANFVPWQGQGPDNDFYVVNVKPNELFTCETFNLSALADTNLILYDANRNGIGGNDDYEPGNRASRFSYYATYLGPMYILIGNVGEVPPGQASQYTYNLRCTYGPPPTPTPLPPTATRVPPPPLPTRPPAPLPTLTPFTPPTLTPFASPTASASPTPFVTPTVQVIVIPVATPTPSGSGIRIVTVELEVYYDANDNAQPDPGEGIINLSARVYDDVTNELLAYGFTDPDGRVNFTVPAPGPVRLELLYLNYVQVIDDAAVVIQIRVVPQPLPGGIP